MNIKQKLTQLFHPKTKPSDIGLSAGIYPYLHDHDGEVTRFHLRVDDSGNGLLIANATMAAALTQTGVLIAHKLLDGLPDQEIRTELQHYFSRVSTAQIEADILAVKNLIGQLDLPGDNYPILNLGDSHDTNQTTPPSPPISADIPLAEPKVMQALLQRLWTLGIPHVTLIVDRKPDTKALVRVVECAEDMGMIAGVRSRGSLLVEAGLIEQLAQVGIDHINLLTLGAAVHDSILQSADHAALLKAYEQIREQEVCAVAEIPLINQTLEHFEETLETLAEHQVTNVAVYAIATEESSPAGALTPDEIIQAADLLEETTAEIEARYLWYPPVQLKSQDTMPAQITGGPHCSGDHAIRVEPNGDAYATRGEWCSIGNIQHQNWQHLRQHAEYQRYLQRISTDTTCERCPGLAICGADCPRDPQGWVRGGAVSSTDTAGAFS